MLALNLFPMKPFVSVALLLFFLLLSGSQGTRLLLEEGSLASQHFQVKESSATQEGGGARGALHCGPHGGHCSGRSRKLLTKATANSESKRSEDTEVKSAQNTRKESKGEVNGSQEELHRASAPPVVTNPQQTYPDILDIAGMDYSPAKRKPPIHN